MTAVFPMPGTAHPAARRAALTLYATEAEDRAWLMQQLPDDFRRQLDQMLHELAELGMPRDPAMVRSVLQDSAPRPPVLPAKAAHFALAHADTAAWVALLDGEPAPLVAHTLGLLPSRQRDAVTAGLNARLRRQVEELGEAAPAREDAALSRAIAREVAARLPRREPVLFWRRALARLVRTKRTP
jgi:hypothetical protein